MLIYGSKSTQIASEIINDKCPSCGLPNSIRMTVFQKYAHLYWIPFFPIGKTATTRCSHCKQCLEKDEFTENLKNRYAILKINSKMPIWTFSGLALLTVLIFWGITSLNSLKERNAKLILIPQKGDIYHIKINYNQYTLYKVDNVVGDTVYVLLNQYVTTKSSGLIALKNGGDESFAQILLPIVKTELKSMFDKGKIIDIDRK